MDLYPAAVRAAAESCKMLCHPARLRILLLLADGEVDAGQVKVAAAGEIDPSMASHHMVPLRAAGLIAFRNSGSYHLYSLTDRGRALLAAVLPLLEPRA